MNSIRSDLDSTRHQLEAAIQASAKNSVSDTEKREKKVLEKKLAEMEEELKTLDQLKADNQRLRDENGALIRVISKLSKWSWEGLDSSEPRKAPNYNRTNLRPLVQHFLTYLAYQCALPRQCRRLEQLWFIFGTEERFWVFRSQVQATVLVCRNECVDEQNVHLDFLNSFFIFQYYLVLLLSIFSINL